MLHDIQLYKVNNESAQIETWLIPSVKIDYTEYNRKHYQQME